MKVRYVVIHFGLSLNKTTKLQHHLCNPLHNLLKDKYLCSFMTKNECLIASSSDLALNRFCLPFKVADVGCVALLCSLFHQRYSEFTPLLKSVIEKSFENINCKDEEKVGYFLYSVFICYFLIAHKFQNLYIGELLCIQNV